MQRQATPIGTGLESWTSEHGNSTVGPTTAQPLQWTSPHTRDSCLKCKGGPRRAWVEIPHHGSTVLGVGRVEEGEGEGEINGRSGEGEGEGEINGRRWEGERKEDPSLSRSDDWHQTDKQAGHLERDLGLSPSQSFPAPDNLEPTRETSLFFRQRTDYCEQFEDEDKTDLKGVATANCQ